MTKYIYSFKLISRYRTKDTSYVSVTPFTLITTFISLIKKKMEKLTSLSCHHKDSLGYCSRKIVLNTFHNMYLRDSNVRKTYCFIVRCPLFVLLVSFSCPIRPTEKIKPSNLLTSVGEMGESLLVNSIGTVSLLTEPFYTRSSSHRKDYKNQNGPFL